MPVASPPGLFFAGSDEEEPPVGDYEKSSSLPPNFSPRTSPPRSSPHNLLFLEDSDDNDSVYMSPKPSTSFKKAKRPIEDEDTNFQIMKHSQVSTDVKPSSQHLRPTFLSPTSDQKSLLPGSVAKKRRLLPPEHESPPNLATEFLPTYIGEIIIPNAWSNVSGKGYVKPNETVLVKREEQDPPAGTSKPKPTTDQSSKKKQISIATMLKPQPAKVSKSAKKKKKNNIVRLVNNKGFGDQRSTSPESCPLNICDRFRIWASTYRFFLVDFKASRSRLVFIHTVSIEVHASLDMVYIRGVMTDCPERLTTGASLIVTLHIYLLSGAFKAIQHFQPDDPSIHLGFNEGLESEEERY